MNTPEREGKMRRDPSPDSMELHPIVPLVVVELLSPGGAWADHIGPRQRENITANLEAAAAEGEGERAVLDLVRLAGLIESEGTVGTLVSDLLELLDRLVMTHQLIPKVLGPAGTYDVSRRRPMHTATGRQVPLRAPKHDEAPPSGAVRVGCLVPARHRA